jgi:hypothetical protein
MAHPKMSLGWAHNAFGPPKKMPVQNKINIKKLQSTFKKSCYRPCQSSRSKTTKIKRERGRERDSGNSSSYEAYNTIA